MKDWEMFEEDCYNYLRNKYSTNGTKFIKLGTSDSTKPDIKVCLTNKKSFYIESKESGAQCGQFVLIPDGITGKFVYSVKNKSVLNNHSRAIINYMNQHFKLFIDAGTSGCEIDLPDQIFYNWILNYYFSHDVRYFITQDKAGFIIFPTEKFDSYFDVSATYRMKKSGSSNPPKASHYEIEELLHNCGIPFSPTEKGGKLYITTKVNLDGKRIDGNKYTYYFRSEGNNSFEVRRLSNTSNSNVIFSIALKQKQNPFDLRNFEAALGY